ncbi:hypothetical protein D1631_02025 [Chryseobacterium nematophagum]|uniref:Fibrobacter succinogenes major paralogous domain-containing protein n=1 Tax=Chryseobacterium nematophagum TaxID=2305228 RepID=A0A3M7TD52_9FLAO|nr:hypothetical protein [Chryseobacterium nematophagum]RNA60797.1 hypothetical protein D1631_02025 [Chryseobacterium nematophagum]
MKHTSINIKKITLLASLILGSYFYGQIRISNSTAVSSAANSSAFIDASSNPSYNGTTNIGKGLLFPRTDLTAFATFSQGPFGIGNNYPTYYDGFIVFNTADSGVAGVGATEGTLCRGYWYYDNPSNTINGGTWKPVRPCSVTPPTTTVQLNCSGAVNLGGNLKQGVPALGTAYTTMVPFTGGGTGTYPEGQPVASTGVLGLTATLFGGQLENGQLLFRIEGIASSSGIASFTFTFQGQTCTFIRIVEGGGGPVNPTNPNTVVMCGSNKAWMTRNLGADQNADPNIPSAQIHGAKYQWGYSQPTVSQAQDQNPAFNNGFSMFGRPSGSWQAGIKTASDPCPNGFIVPSIPDYTVLRNNNNPTPIGTFSGTTADYTNFGSAVQFTCSNGSKLTFPTAGFRFVTDGSLSDRGFRGWYQVADVNGAVTAMSSGNVLPGTQGAPGNGYSVRCISQ